MRKALILFTVVLVIVPIAIEQATGNWWCSTDDGICYCMYETDCMDYNEDCSDKGGFCSIHWSGGTWHCYCAGT